MIGVHRDLVDAVHWVTAHPHRARHPRLNTVMRFISHTRRPTQNPRRIR